MDEIKYFLTTVHRNDGTYTKGVVVHDTSDAAQQGFHNEFTAWAYGKVPTCDYVFAMICDSNGAIIRPAEIWKADKTTEA